MVFRISKVPILPNFAQNPKFALKGWEIVKKKEENPWPVLKPVHFHKELPGSNTPDYPAYLLTF